MSKHAVTINMEGVGVCAFYKVQCLVSIPTPEICGC